MDQRGKWVGQGCELPVTVLLLVPERPSSVSAPLQAPTSLSSQPAQGMVLSAEYIKKKLEQEMVLSQAFGRDLVSRAPRHRASTMPRPALPQHNRLVNDGATPEDPAPSLSFDPWLPAPSLAQSLLPALTPSSFAPAPLGHPCSAPPSYKHLLRARY